MDEFSLTLVRRERPLGRDADAKLEWLLRVLGSGRFAAEYARILKDVVACMRRGEQLHITAYAHSRGYKRTVLSYHVQKLVSMGVLRRSGRGYTLRASNLERTVEEIKRDVDRLFEDILRVARELDELLGLPRG